MTRLSGIIDAAMGDATPAATLLRMVRVVATRLGTVQLEEWVERELSGYGDADQLPPYRGPFDAAVLGHFSGPFGSEVTVPIPPAALPAKYRDGWLFRLAFRQPVSELEGLVGAEDNLRNMWHADAVVGFNQLVGKGEAHGIEMHGLVEAWKVVTPQQVAGVLDQVRTRVLTLALELEKIAPDAGELGAESPAPSAVATVINTHIYGGSNSVAVASPNAALSVSVARGDLASLLAALHEVGLPDDDIAALEAAVLEDARVEEEANEPGPALSRIMGRLTLGVGNAAGKIAIGAAGGTVAALIRAYFGIG